MPRTRFIENTVRIISKQTSHPESSFSFLEVDVCMRAAVRAPVGGPSEEPWASGIVIYFPPGTGIYVCKERELFSDPHVLP